METTIEKFSEADSAVINGIEGRMLDLQSEIEQLPGVPPESQASYHARAATLAEAHNQLLDRLRVTYAINPEAGDRVDVQPDGSHVITRAADLPTAAAGATVPMVVRE